MKLDGHAHPLQSVKYLGVYLTAGKKLCFDLSPVKRAFYTACNSIFSHGSGLDEIALLHLQEVTCQFLRMPHRHCYSKSDKSVNCLCVGIWLFVKFLDITNGNQLERLLMVWGELMRKITFHWRIFNHLKNSVFCRLFCVFLNGSNLYDDCTGWAKKVDHF